MRVSTVTDVGDRAVAVTLEAPEGFGGAPGQFVVVEPREADESGYYTISSPTVDDTFEITVEVDPEEGDIGPWLASREQGDEVAIDGPYGNVTYEGKSDIAVLAGGPGVGPAVGIAERAIESGHDATIAYLDNAPIHGERLDALSDDGADVTVAADEEKFEDVVSTISESTHVFVFGFERFVELATEMLEAEGVDPSTADVESFGPK